MSFSLILTHPGGSHKDEFLACCLLLALHRVPVVRREPSDADLADPATAVVDVGDRHEPHLGNFDHHQFPKDHPPLCALSLVLQHLGLYDDARSFCDWLEPAEWLDTRGPVETSRWLGIGRDTLAKLNSPIDVTLLRRFAATGDARARDMALDTLTHMAQGGIYDQIGGGFCRYSVDARWNIPHFEKMLYDNGPLLRLYAEAFALSGKALYAEVAEHWRRSACSGMALYRYAEARAEEMGYVLNLGAPGHRLGDFPHSVHRAGKLADQDHTPSPARWVLEIQLRHPNLPIGAFYEDLLQ